MGPVALGWRVTAVSLDVLSSVPQLRLFLWKPFKMYDLLFFPLQLTLCLKMDRATNTLNPVIPYAPPPMCSITMTILSEH